MTGHIALLGDSVFDNASYTQGEPDVAAHLRVALGDSWRVTLLAVDGTTTTDVGAQLRRISKPMSHLVLSVGGNDALRSTGLLSAPVRSTSQAPDLLRGHIDTFEANYGHVLEAIAKLGRQLLVCTIYNGNLAGDEARVARVALMLFNDVIVRGALAANADLLELRTVCRSTDDYANPIEPSGTGGEKIARAIAAALRGDGSPASLIYGPASGA